MGQKISRPAAPALKALRRRFDHWRQSGRKGRKIPNALWRDAAALARTHGVSCVAQDLGLDYNDLKRRVNEGMHAEVKNLTDIDGSGFIELSMDAVLEKPECILAFASQRGQLTIRLKGHHPEDVVSLAKALACDGP